MYKIKAIAEAGGLRPETTLPKENVAMILCDGSDYIIYEQGDELPAQEEQQGE
jgi:hypothetical protein